jgi:ribosomal protein S18 acetylase RimI-like enzyme
MNLVFNKPLSSFYWQRVEFVSNGINVGEISVQLKDKNHLHLWNFIIIEQLRNKGYGKEALTKLLKHYEDYIITLGVYADNKPALHLYRSLGFELISGHGGGCYIMQKMKPNETEDTIR